VEYAEAIYHLLSCGDHREVIVGDAKAARFAFLVERKVSACVPSHQSAPAKVTQIAAARALDQIDRELEQANLPGVVHSLNHRAERLV
jgi:hypothetical protein